MRRPRLWLLLAAVLAVGIGLATLKSVSPTAFPSIMPQCVVHKVTGLHCPGCGGTRAAHLALNGEWALAFRHHAPFVIGLPVLALAGLAAIFSRTLRHRIHRILAQPRTWGLFVAAMLVFGVLRNLPFSWTRPLAPPAPVSVGPNPGNQP